MDFSLIDIHAFLKASMPHRFQDIGPYDFEKFMAALFREDGYEVHETEYSGDFGADLILTKDGETTAVQVKRYAVGTQVGVSDVNQVIGATSYYSADNSLVVTTSDFTASAITLAKSAEVILWNWDRLEKYISTVYFEDQDYHLFFDQTHSEVSPGEQDEVDMFDVSLLEIENDTHTPDNQEAIEVHVAFSNNSERNLTVHIDPPILVSKKSGRQVTAIHWKENYFFHGVLVSGATVELACFFLKAQIKMVKPGDRMILYIHVAGEEQAIVLDEKLSLPRNNCYVVTYCYGRNSPEYHNLIMFRDLVLAKNTFGRACVQYYYQYSPRLVALLRRSIWARRILQPILLLLVRKTVLLLRNTDISTRC